MIEQFNEKSKKYENSLDIPQKKEYGIFYTDINLAKKIISFLNLPQNAVILDPCCGSGSFIFSAKEANYQKVYGADIDQTAVSLCKKLTKKRNIETLDTIENSGKYTLEKLRLKKRVDCVIGNPPYVPLAKDFTFHNKSFDTKVKQSGNNLSVAAIYRAFELTKNSGIISFIVPKNLLHVSSYKNLRKTLLTEKSIVSIVDIGAYFKEVRGEQIILTLQNQPIPNNDILLYRFIDNKFEFTLRVPQNFFKDEILLFNNKDDFNIYLKLESSIYPKFSQSCAGTLARGNSESQDAVTGKDIRKFGLKSKQAPHRGNRVFIQNIYSSESGVIASFGGFLEASQTVTVYLDEDEAMCHYLVGILHSKLCNYYLIKFCYNNSKLTMHTDAKYLKKLPIIKSETFSQIVKIVNDLEKIDYMNNKWFEKLENLNSLIYKTYSLTEEEIIYIDLEMKAIQSKRWNND